MSFFIQAAFVQLNASSMIVLILGARQVQGGIWWRLHLVTEPMLLQAVPNTLRNSVVFEDALCYNFDSTSKSHGANSCMLPAGARHVHACEWNPAALEALQRNLDLNGVADRCTILPGDCRVHAPKVSHLLLPSVLRLISLQPFPFTRC